MTRCTSGTINIQTVTGVIVITAMARVPIVSTAYTSDLMFKVLTLTLNGEEQTMSSSTVGETFTLSVLE